MIPMQPNIDKIYYLTGNKDMLLNVPDQETCLRIQGQRLLSMLLLMPFGFATLL